MYAVVMSPQTRGHAKDRACDKCGRTLVNGEIVYRTHHAFKTRKRYICKDCYESMFSA